MTRLHHINCWVPVAANILIFICFYRYLLPEEWSLPGKINDSIILGESVVRDNGVVKSEILRSISSDRQPMQQSQHKIVLLGPHDRFNFGDLLFEKVVHKLLLDRAGYAPENILVGGIITTDMTKYGGASTILSMKVIQQLSEKAQYPFDIVYLGGEAMGCDHECGVRMLPTKKQRQEAVAEKVCECAYLFPKKDLVGSNYVGPTNMAIVNSLGGSPATACKVAGDTADYHSYRDATDPELLFPDSAVMTRALYGTYIENITNFPNLEEIIRKEPQGYVAVQFMESLVRRPSDESKVVLTLDDVARDSNLPIVFFAAGTVPRHDSFDLYKRIAGKLNATTYILDKEPNVWGVVATVAHAKAVISTSLHVRIMAFQFQKPRVTVCTKGKKHHRFIQVWEQMSDQDACQSVETVAAALQKSQPVGDERLNEVVERYLVNFDNWSNLLKNGNRTIIHA